MKLNVAATVLAYAAMNLATVSAVYSNSAGTCLSAVIANAGQQQDVDWSDEAAYYTIGNANNNYNNYNANNNGEDGDEEQEQEAEAEEAEYNIRMQMRSLAEALGLDAQEEDDGEDGNNQQAFNHQELNYVMAYDEELANKLGMEDDRSTFAKFYSVLYDLALSGDGDQCNAGNNNVNYDNNNNNNDGDADDANEGEQEDDMDEEEDREDENEDEEDDREEENDEEDDREEENEEEDDRDEEQNDEEGDQEGEEGEEGEGEDEDGEGRRLEDEQQVEDSVTSIVRNCGSVFQAFGVDLGDMDMDEDNDELQEALHDLSIHIRIEKAIASGAFNFEDGINYNFAANGNEDNGGEGNYDEEFYNLLQSLDIDANELEEDDIMNIKLKLAVKSGSLKEHLEANAAFGSVVDDWEGVIQGFFYSLGIEEEINLEDIDSYLAADIYNTAYDLEEYGCEQAMLNQFGKSDAKDYGYIENTNPIVDFFNATVEKFTSGQTAGIVIGVLIAVGIIGCCAFRCGKKAGTKSRSSRNDPLIGGTAV